MVDIVRLKIRLERLDEACRVGMDHIERKNVYGEDKGIYAEMRASVCGLIM